MTLEEALKRNPYDPAKGNLSAYIRYLRYNVDGWYEKTSEEVRRSIGVTVDIDLPRREYDEME